MSALTLQPDLSQAERFLTLLDESAESFTFQTVTDTPSGAPKPSPDPLAAVKHGTLAQHARWLTAMNRKGAGCFVCVNEADGKGRGHSNITRIRALWVDDDTGQAPPLPIEPHVIVQTSPGKRQVYVLVDDMPREDFDAAQARMVQDYGSDKAAQGINRVLRLPGFWHLKNRNSPHMVSIIHEAGTRPIPWAKLRSILPPVERQAQAPKDTEAVVTVTAGQVAELRSALNAISPDDYGTWIAMGHALVELGNVGRELWLSWSQQSGKWQPQDARRWATFAGERTAYQAVFAEAQRQGWVNPKAKSDVPPIPPMPQTEDEQHGRKEPDLDIVSLAGIASYRPQPPVYLIEPLIPRRHLTLLGGHGEAGKSQLGLILAAHVAVGKPWAGLTVRQGKVVVVSMEDDKGEFLYRIKKIIDEYALDPVELDANLKLIDAHDAGPLATELNEFGNKHLRFTPYASKIEEAARWADLLVIDNASDAFDADDNCRRQVRAFIKTLVGWVRGHHGAVLLLAHIDKAGARRGTDGNSYLGSVQWHNGPRSRLALEKDKTVQDTVHLKHEKLNVGRKHPEAITLQWGANGVLMPISTEASEIVAKWTDTTNDEAIFKAIKAALEAGKTLPNAITGGHTAWHQLVPFPELPVSLKTAQGKKRVDAAMIRLQRAGVIKIESYVANDYKTRTRWVLAAEEATQDATDADAAQKTTMEDR